MEPKFVNNNELIVLERENKNLFISKESDYITIKIGENLYKTLLNTKITFKVNFDKIQQDLSKFGVSGDIGGLEGGTGGSQNMGGIVGDDSGLDDDGGQNMSSTSDTGGLNGGTGGSQNMSGTIDGDGLDSGGEKDLGIHGDVGGIGGGQNMSGTIDGDGLDGGISIKIPFKINELSIDNDQKLLIINTINGIIKIPFEAINKIQLN